MVLSQECSILRAIVVSGDEDLREGVDYAQDRGVRVAVVGIEADGHQSQSLDLVRAADEHVTLPVAILERTLTRRRSDHVTAGRGGVGTVFPPMGPADAALCVESAKQLALEWLERARPRQRAALVAIAPRRIAHDLDADILQRAVRASGFATIPDEVRREMRKAFWSTLDAETGRGAS
jgi:hypothetical protein